MTEYHWQWMKPDRTGLWLFGGRMPGDQQGTWCVIKIDSLPHSDAGWWCFLMGLPAIKPPKRKTVWRMWVVPEPGYRRLLTAHWMQDGQEPSRAGAIRTDKTEEREE